MWEAGEGAVGQGGEVANRGTALSLTLLGTLGDSVDHALQRSEATYAGMFTHHPNEG